MAAGDNVRQVIAGYAVLAFEASYLGEERAQEPFCERSA